MKSILEKIVDYKKAELESLKRKVTLKDLKFKSADQKPAAPFLGFFKKNGINIIAEIKKASPSAGIIREDFQPLKLAETLEHNGAVALSVLTDEHFFGGSLEILSGVKKIAAIPCLKKDFTLHEYHVYEARAYGADATLLIACLLDSFELKGFCDLASDLGMASLVEVHDEKDLGKALACNCRMIGVNNRDLKTFKTDPAISLALAQKIPVSTARISESGLKTHDDIVFLQKAGFDGFLVGETLMREKDPGKKLAELILGS